VGQDGWEEVADYALEWAVEHAKHPAAWAKPQVYSPECVEGKFSKVGCSLRS
jgi:hypothetical protein